jgi:hypothetical protein
VSGPVHLGDGGLKGTYGSALPFLGGQQLPNSDTSLVFVSLLIFGSEFYIKFRQLGITN